MQEIPDYRARMGVGEPLLTVQVGDVAVSLHRKEAQGLENDPALIGSLHMREVGPDHESGGLVGHPWSGTTIGNQQIICGELPSKAVTAEATVAAIGAVPVHLANGVWLVVAPRTERLQVTFRTATGRVVKRVRIPVMPELPDLDALARADGWIDDPSYLPPDNERHTSSGTWDDLIARYGLGAPLVTLPIGTETASVYQQWHTGKAWLAVTGLGGSLGPISSDVGWDAHYIDDVTVITGSLPPTAVTAEARSREGQPLPVRSAAGVFLVVAPAAHEVQITFRNAKGRRVWQHQIEAKHQLEAKMDHAVPSGVLELPGIYWSLARLLWLRLLARWTRQRG
jgi:hypothetical protein